MFFDIFFISFNEPNCEINFQSLRDRFPTIKRTKDVVGIANAHVICAKNSQTAMFYTIDADTHIDNTWNFFYKVPVYDQKYLHIWYSRNPINDLEYGYGGIKLWPTIKVLNNTKFYLDYSTETGDIKIVQNTISTSAFNTSPYQTWKSAFRECVKLANNLTNLPNDIDSQYRLNRWLSYANPTASYADWCLRGANDGYKWYSKNTMNVNWINDFNWLHQEYIRRYN